MAWPLTSNSGLAKKAEKRKRRRGCMVWPPTSNSGEGKKNYEEKKEERLHGLASDL